MFKDETGQIVPAIISEEPWDSANAVLKKRSEDVKNRQSICCAAAYYRCDSVARYIDKIFAAP